MAGKTTVQIDHGQAVRLLLVFCWMILLCAYCFSESRDEFEGCAGSESHPDQADSFGATSEEKYHVEIVEFSNDSEEGPIEWQIFRDVLTDHKSDTAKQHARNLGMNLQTPSHHSFWQRRTKRIVRRFTGQTSTVIFNCPPPIYFSVLGCLVLAAILLTFFYGVAVFLWGWGDSFVPHLTFILVCFVVIVHIILTALQGGLLVSPVGQTYTTVVALLIAHAMASLEDHTRKIKKHNFLPAALLGIGSICAHYYAAGHYDKSIALVLQQLYSDEYMRFLLASLVVGSISIISRRWKTRFKTLTIAA